MVFINNIYISKWSYVKIISSGFVLKNNLMKKKFFIIKRGAVWCVSITYSFESEVLDEISYIDCLE